ncbi:MAG TPA: diacylglycerol kinase family protein [Acidobacteriaceae bacterium]|nr:diacylglycerol kinase family protein [Acidobacteriaceae bacterium]
MRRVLFFLNPFLVGRGGRRALVGECAALLRADGCTVEMQETLSAYSAGDQAREAVASGFDTIFVCGGDGTLFQILQGVAGSETALGVIPFGTGNVVAQNLRLPRDPVAALRAQRDGNSRSVVVPLGEVRCRALRAAAGGEERRWYFTIAAGLGMHAALMALAPNETGKRVWGRAAYFADGLKLLARRAVEPFDVEITRMDGTTTSLRASELLGVRVAEINRWKAGGDLCSPWLRMAAVPQTGRVGLAHAIFHALFTGKNTDTNRAGGGLPYPYYEDVAQIMCRPVAGHRYAAPMLVEADGEVVGVGPATFRMAKKTLKLLWPQG